MTESPLTSDGTAQLSSLLARVASGKLSREDADLAADAAGLGTLSCLPDLHEFWPTGRPYWTLTMVLAWITWRTYAEVREWDPRYLELRRDWGRLGASGETELQNGYGLFKRRPPTFAQFERWGDLRLGPWHGRDGKPAVLQWAPREAAWPDLRRALQAGKLSAYAVSPNASERGPIPAVEWADLEIVEAPAGTDELRFRRDPKAKAYDDVLFSQADVLGLWPPHVRSDLDERGDFTISPIVEDEAARGALFELIEAGDLMRPADQSHGPALRQRAWTQRDLEALKVLNEQRVSDGQKPLTVTETLQWARARDISREGGRQLRQSLPRELKLKRGERTFRK